MRWVDRDIALTFAEAVTAMEHCAGALHHLGVRKGDRVTIFAHNGMDYVLALFACWRIGAIAALVNVRFADELEYYFADHAPSVVIYTHDMDAAVRRAAASVATIRSLVCMDGPQPGAESLPALLAADLVRAARSGRRGRDRAPFLHLRHHWAPEGRVPRPRADHAGDPLHR